MLGPTSKPCLVAMLGPTSKSVGRTLLGSCWTKTKVGQDKDHVGIHIGQHQSDVGADIKVMLGQDEGQHGFGLPSWVKMKAILGSTLANVRAMLGPTSKSSWKGMLGPTSKSCWAKTKVGQNKGHVGVHIGQHRGHVGADIKVMLGQDEGQHGFGLPSWVKIKAMLVSTLANIRAMLGPISKSSWKGHVRADIKVMLGQDESRSRKSSWKGHVRADIKVLLGQDEGRSR